MGILGLNGNLHDIRIAFILGFSESFFFAECV